MVAKIVFKSEILRNNSQHWKICFICLRISIRKRKIIYLLTILQWKEGRARANVKAWHHENVHEIWKTQFKALRFNSKFSFCHFSFEKCNFLILSSMNTQQVHRIQSTGFRNYLFNPVIWLLKTYIAKCATVSLTFVRNVSFWMIHSLCAKLNPTFIPVTIHSAVPPFYANRIIKLTHNKNLFFSSCEMPIDELTQKKEREFTRSVCRTKLNPNKCVFN